MNKIEKCKNCNHARGFHGTNKPKCYWNMSTTDIVMGKDTECKCEGYEHE